MHIHTSLLLFTLGLALAQKGVPDVADSIDFVGNSLNSTGLNSSDSKILALDPRPYETCFKIGRRCLDGCCRTGNCCGGGCVPYDWTCVITAEDKETPKICSEDADKCRDVVAEIKLVGTMTVTSTLGAAPTWTIEPEPTPTPTLKPWSEVSPGDMVSGGERFVAGLWMVGAAAAAGLVLLGRG